MEFPESFLPRRITRAADAEMIAVLEEDAALRAAGIEFGARRATGSRRPSRPQAHR